MCPNRNLHTGTADSSEAASVANSIPVEHGIGVFVGCGRHFRPF